jgi:hypothetical protein
LPLASYNIILKFYINFTVKTLRENIQMGIEKERKKNSIRVCNQFNLLAPSSI